MRKLRMWPDQILTKTADPAWEHADYHRLVAEMFHMMKHKKGIGLAAPQLGEPVRIITISLQGLQVAILNPQIIRFSKATMVNEEGCLSFPGKYVKVSRSKEVKVKGFNVDWEPIKQGGKELLSAVLQHEIDHLDGITMLDRKWKPVPS